MRFLTLENDSANTGSCQDGQYAAQHCLDANIINTYCNLSDHKSRCNIGKGTFRLLGERFIACGISLFWGLPPPANVLKHFLVHNLTGFVKKDAVPYDPLDAAQPLARAARH